MLMNKKLVFMVSLFLILNINIALGATLHGTIYDSSLNPLENAIVELDSVPKQTYVSKQGSYSFKAPSGDYTIKATYQSQAITFVAQENIIVKDEGDYVIDMILFPDISEESELLDEDIDISDIDFEEKPVTLGFYAFIIGVLFFIIILIIYFKKIKQKTKKSTEADRLSDETAGIIDFIKKNEGRVTQKEIRKNFQVSEAKISLMMSELERKGKIKKIETGKGNIIILKK